MYEDLSQDLDRAARKVAAFLRVPGAGRPHWSRSATRPTPGRPPHRPPRRAVHRPWQAIMPAQTLPHAARPAAARRHPVRQTLAGAIGAEWNSRQHDRRSRHHRTDDVPTLDGPTWVRASRSPKRRHPGRTRRNVPSAQPTASRASGTTARRIERSTASRGSPEVAAPQPLAASTGATSAANGAENRAPRGAAVAPRALPGR